MKVRNLKKQIKNDIIYYLITFYVLISFFLNLLKNYFHSDGFLDLLWFCNIVAIVLGLSMLFRKKKAVTICLVTSIPAQFLWIIDFFLELFGGGFGRTSFLFNEPIWVIAISTNLHVIIVPASIYAVYKLGFARNILHYILILTFFILTASFLLSDLNTNKNCVFYDCDSSELPHGDEKFDYLGYFIINSLLFWMIVLTLNYYLLNYVISFFENKSKKSKRNQKSKS